MKKEMKKDILVMSQFFYPEYITSAMLPYETAVELASHGYSVGALCGYPQNYNDKEDVPSHEEIEGITIDRINYHNFNKNNFLGRLLNYFAFTFSMILNVRKAKEYKTIIVYSTPPILPLVAVLAKKLYKTKVIFVSYDIYPEVAVRMGVVNQNSIITKVMSAINKLVFKNASRVVALSTEMKSFIDKNRDIDPDDIVIIPNWANEVVIKNKNDVTNPLFDPLIADGKTIVSYFGNMGTAQDMDTIMEAIRSLKEDENIHFLFAGHGNKMDLLKEVIKKEKLENVTIHGFLHGQDYIDALSISDGFLVSLEKGLDGLCVPSKTYSYMSAGRPILSIMNPRCDISKEVVEHHAGFAIENSDSIELTKAILSLKNKDLVNQMSENCKELFLSKYTKKICTKSYAKMVEKVLEEK